MLYIRKLFTQDLRDGKQIAFPKEPSNLFFSFDFSNNEEDRVITFTFRANFEQFQEYEGKVIRTRLYSAGSESRMDGEVKAFIRDLLHAQVNDLLIFKNKGTRFTEFEVMFVPQTNVKYYPLLVTLSGGDNHSVFSIEKDLFDSSDEKLPLQRIFYGAPGTGKSNTIKCEVDEKGKSCIRTTFHPDSDYSTFVGCYKPTTKRVPMYTTYGEKAVPVKDENGEQIMEDRIIYEYVGQAFFQAYTEAWKKYAAVTEGKPAEQYLIVEEINRGNCAQIFGDLFQLLDRNDSGFSDYPIKADADLKKQLAKVFVGLNIAKKDSINALYKNEKDVVSQVLSGDILLLPNNLYIWATMNTSDQSLFPIDSAFKRRWDWEYVPIANANKKWKIEVSGLRYDWWDFLEKINEEIGKATSSEDKKLGYFFCKAKDDKGIIDAKTFVSKVIFYLWNDVFKDFADETATLFKATDGGSLSFNDFYRTEGNTTTANEDAIKQFLNNLGINGVSVEEMTDDEEDIDENGNPNSRDQSKYTINGDGKFKKSPLAREIVSRYLNSHPATSVEEALSIFNPIRTANFSYVESEFEYSQETPDSQTKRFWKVEWGDGKVIYVTKRWSLESITPVIDFVNNSDWGMTIAKVE